jgi:hypothetical protein
VLAAQEWKALCDELTSGRLSDYLRRAQRTDVLPRLDRSRSADEQLDDWLGRLPTTKPSAPELDVHPVSLNVKAVAGGGVTRQTLRLTNVGYRLLRSTVRVEPESARWLRISTEFHGRPFSTVDETDLAVEFDLPETLDAPLEASILIESNGGTRRVPVRVEKAQATTVPAEFEVPVGSEAAMLGGTLRDKLVQVPPATRVFWGAGFAFGLRLLVLLTGFVLHGAGDARLSSVALSLVGAGGVIAILLSLRRAEEHDLLAAAFAGGSLGLLAAGLAFAVIQALERILGPWSTSVWAVGPLWAAIGALAALVSNYLVPYRPAASEVSG